MTVRPIGAPSVAGSISFEPHVRLELITQAMHELAAMADPERVVDLHIRVGGNDGSHIMGFHYVMLRGTQTEQSFITKKIIAHLMQSHGLVPKEDMTWSMGTVDASV